MMNDLLARIRRIQAELAGDLKRNATPSEIAFELSVPLYVVLTTLKDAGDTAA